MGSLRGGAPLGAAADIFARISCYTGSPARIRHRQEGMDNLAKVPPGVGPKHAQVVVLVGATGDLSQRRLLPGLFHLTSAGFIPGCRIIGVSLDHIDSD